MLSSRNIERMLKIEELGSFSKAADQLFVTRSALVQQVKQFEEELGFTVFFRDHRGVHPTEAGKLFLTRAQYMIRDYNHLVTRCVQMQNGGKERIVIGSMPNLSAVAIPKICKAFRKEHPDVEIEFRDFFPQDYFQKFRLGEFDVTADNIAAYLHNEPDLLFLKLMEDRHSCEVPPDHPLAESKLITYESLRGHTLMLYKRGITKCDDLLRDYITKNEPEIRLIDIDAYDSSLLARCEMEQAVVLSYSFYRLSFPGFVSIPTNWDIPIDIGIGYRKDCRPVVKEFIKTAESLFNLPDMRTDIGGQD